MRISRISHICILAGSIQELARSQESDRNWIDQTTLGILSIIAAGVFVAIFFKMVITRKKEEKEEEKGHDDSK